MNTLVELGWHFLLISLMAFGGASAMLPEMYRFLVDQYHWISSQTFSALYAISQASPGPNVLFVALYGRQVAGFAGAVVSLVAMCGPSSLIAMLVERYTARHSDAMWMTVIRRSLAPVTIGLLLSTGSILAQSSNRSVLAYGLTALTVLVGLRTRINPLWLIAIGALLGMMRIL